VEDEGATARAPRGQGGGRPDRVEGEGTTERAGAEDKGEPHAPEVRTRARPASRRRTRTRARCRACRGDEDEGTPREPEIRVSCTC